MSENGTTIPVKGLGNIKWKDFWKSLYYAAASQIIALVVFFIKNILQLHPHLPTWGEWLPYVQMTVYAIGGYIAAKFGVNNVGQIFQKYQPIVHIDVDSLNELKEKAASADTKE